MSGRWLAWAIGALGSLPSVTAAQTPLNGGSPPDNPERPTVGGTPTIDFVTLQSNRPAVPLRFGGVLSGSDRVDLDGRRLTRGEDYTIDLSSGILYLTRPIRDGQTLLVAYRYEKENSKQQVQSFAGLGMIKFDLVPKSLGFVVGLGVTERLPTGDVLSSNIYGWNGNFAFGSGSLKGLYLLGEREKLDVRSVYEYVAPSAAPDTGRSHLVLQNLSSKLNGGTIEASYQDVSKNFAGFGAARDAGYDDAQLGQLQKERGLKRIGLVAKDVGIGGLKLSHSFRSVTDGDEGIDWRSFNLASGGLNAHYSSQKVDQGFRRFKDLAEADRAQLAKEAGMSRTSYGFGYAAKGTKLSYDLNQISDQGDRDILSRRLQFESGSFKLDAGDQKVESGFSRMNSLPDAEKNRLAREIGIARKWLNFSVPGKQGDALQVQSSKLTSNTGSFESADVKTGGRGWSLEHSSREVGQGFSSMSALQDSERDAHMKAITNMYHAGGFPWQGQDVSRFFSGQGISRSLTRLSLTPFKGWSMGADRLNVESQQGGVTLDTISVSGAAFSLGYRSQAMDDGFHGLASLMDFERQRLGTIVGLDRTDLTASLKLAKGGKIELNRMTAEAPDGGASRESLKLNQGGLDVQWNRRSVDEGFSGVSQLIDPEKDLLTQIRGFSESDFKAAWQLSPNLRLEAFHFDAQGLVRDEDRFIRNYSASWTPDKATKLAVFQYRSQNDDPANLLLLNAFEAIAFARDLGKYGKLTYRREAQEFAGTQASLPDSEKQQLAYEAKLNEKTSFRTEQTLTRYEDGKTEEVNSNTVNTALGKSVGLSVSNVVIDRTGSEQDENKQAYGFWFDLPGGVRISYGMLQHLAGANGRDSRSSQIAITPGQIGNLNVQQGGHLRSEIEGAPTKSGGNIQIATKKPFSLGIFDDLQFYASADTHRENSITSRDNQQIKLSGRIGSNVFATEYRGQIHSNGKHAIDRSFEFSTDQSEKNWLRASVKYKVRTMPWDEQFMIRSYSIAARPTKDIELTHQLLTNPTVDRGDALLGSVVQASHMSRWKLDFKGNGDVRVGGQWEEIMNQQHPRQRTGGLNVTLNARSESPVHLYYGLEQRDAPDGRKTTHRYHLRFDQKPGPNQLFSIFMGNVSYQHDVVNGKQRDNWTLRVDYQLRF